MNIEKLLVIQNDEMLDCLTFIEQLQKLDNETQLVKLANMKALPAFIECRKKHLAQKQVITTKHNRALKNPLLV